VAPLSLIQTLAPASGVAKSPTVEDPTARVMAFEVTLT
jgi:hypothetical protein